MRRTSTWKIGEIYGVELRVHASLIILLFYLIYMISARFSEAALEVRLNPADLIWGPVYWGVILSVGLFASVVAHEYGHAWVAQKLGQKVNGITLMMLGGISDISPPEQKSASQISEKSEISQILENRYSEFKLAIIGPLISLALAVLFLTGSHLNAPAPIMFFSHWMGRANLVLGIFNLLPAFPLDGGRALRSLLAARQGKLRGTQTAVKLSKVLAMVMGFMGILSFNILLVLIAFFVYNAAQSELFFVLSRSLLHGLKIKDVTITLSPVSDREPLSRVAQFMMNSRNNALPVLTSNGAPGVVTLQQIKTVPRDFWDVTLVKDVMGDSERYLMSDEAVGDSLPDIANSPGVALPVKDSAGHLMGLVKYSDLRDILQFKSLGEVHKPVGQKQSRAA